MANNKHGTTHNFGLAFLPRNVDRGNYVYRMKVQKERNKMNLPGLEYPNYKNILKLPKKPIAPDSRMARSLTLDSIKLPSLKQTGSARTDPPGRRLRNESPSSTVGAKSIYSLPSVNLQDVQDETARSLPIIPVSEQDMLREKEKPNSLKGAFHSKSLNLNVKFQKISNSKKLVMKTELPTIHSEQRTASTFHVDEENGRVQKRVGGRSHFRTVYTHSDDGHDNVGSSKTRHIKKWKEDCECMRCDMLRVRYIERDNSYRIWGRYPCQPSPGPLQPYCDSSSDDGK